MKVGCIGLGSMGAGMSRNLIKAGHDLVVYSRTQINIRTLLRLPSLADRTLRLRASCSSCRRGQVNQSRNAAACLPRWGKRLS
jgi:6-phosphogluconate dehydrogenase (decarboxylating)